MTFAKHGYKHETVEVREMTMADIVVTVGESLVINDKTDMEVRIIDCFNGKIDRWAGLKSLMLSDYVPDWKVKVYKMEAAISSDGEYFLVVMSDSLEQ